MHIKDNWQNIPYAFCMYWLESTVRVIRHLCDKTAQFCNISSRMHKLQSRIFLQIWAFASNVFPPSFSPYSVIHQLFQDSCMDCYQKIFSSQEFPVCRESSGPTTLDLEKCTCHNLHKSILIYCRFEKPWRPGTSMEQQ